MKLTVSEVTYLFYNRKTYDYKKLDALMEEALGIPNFSDGKIRLTKDQYEVIIGLLDVLLHKGEVNDRDKTDSGKAQVREADGDANNRLQGRRIEPKLDTGLADLRSVSEVRSSPGVSPVQPEGRTED